MTDDHATQALSCYGSKINTTPNLDRIASEGMLFKNCFVTNSICAPSRAAIFTGKYSHLNGVKDNADIFDGTQLTYPKLLQQNGYETAIIGKWHLGSEPTGFDYWSILPSQGDYYNPDFIEMGDTIQSRGYVTDIVTDKSLSWLDKRDKEKPFLLVYQQKAPHRNWMPGPDHLTLFKGDTIPEPKTFFDNYENRGSAAKEQEMEIAHHLYDVWDLKLATKEDIVELTNIIEVRTSGDALSAKDRDFHSANDEIETIKNWLSVYNRMDEEQKDAWHKAYDQDTKTYRENMGSYSEMEIASWKYQRYIKDYLRTIASVDDNVRRILDYLEESGELDNTIIVYTSDQGFFLGEHGWFDKRFMYEESLRMPLMIRYPPLVNKGVITETLAVNIDFAPTLLDLAGVEIPDEMQGKSFKQTLLGDGSVQENWRKAIYYHYYEYPSWHSVKRHYGIRTKDFKLIHFYNDIDEWELYNLKEDPLELNNLISDPSIQTKNKRAKTTTSTY